MLSNVIKNMNNIHNIFESRKDDPKWNTSYPLQIEDWKLYRVRENLPFCGVTEMSIYIHIPFCQQLCAFCEYARIACPSEMMQKNYLNGVNQDILSFMVKHEGLVTLRGFDIGGGTPTALSEKNFDILMDIYDQTIAKCISSVDFESSIEGTFNTLSIDKIRRMVTSGIKRLSLGVQSTSRDVLNNANRQSARINEMQYWMNTAWDSGVDKINLDLMFGLQGQNESTIAADLLAIEVLKPQQVTLYELRTNMISLKEIPDKTELYTQYSSYYKGLISLGYLARFGQNTFSLNTSDFGVSSYLRSRMHQGVPYKGFGISAQSMSPEGISYNVGKSRATVKQAISGSSFGEEFTYFLPPKELSSKYIAIAAYSGSFSLQRVSKLLKIDAEEYFRDELDYCIGAGLLHVEGGRVFITECGFKYYGAVFSLFYAKTTYK